VSTTGSGSDQPHLLALLRAIRLRHGAEEAAAAGAADTEAALRDQKPSAGTPTAAPDGETRNGEPTHPEGLVHPRWPSSALPAPQDRPALGAPQDRPALGAPQDRPALGAPQERPALRAAQEQPSLRAPVERPALPSAHPLRDVTGRQVPRAEPTDAPAVPSEPPALPQDRASAQLDDAAPPDAAEPGHFQPAWARPRPGGQPPPGPVRALPAGSPPPVGPTPPVGPPAVPALPAPGVRAPRTGRLPALPTPSDGTVPSGPHHDPVPGRPGGPTFGPMPGGTQGPPGIPPGIPTASTNVSGVGGIPGGPGMPRAGHPMPGQPMPGDPVQPPVPLLPPPVSMPGHAGAASPADGMDPADDAALRELQGLLSNSLSLAGGPEGVAARLRTALAQAQPQLFAPLPGNPAFQREQLAQALAWLVHNLDQPPVMVAGCGQLGAALAECGIHPQQLQLVGAALAEAMRAGMAAGAWRQDFDQAWRTTWQHAYEWIAHGEALSRYQPTTWTAVVVDHDRRRDDLAIVRLRPYLPMPFRPGQYARIEVPGVPGVWRPYSLAGAPRRDNTVELHVRAKTEAGVSGTLVYRTNVGDTVRISRAEGAMGLAPEPDRDLLMIAGDTGVAPLKALLTELAATGDPRSAVLFWGARTLDELYDIDEIAEIARAARRATVVPVISEGEAGPYASGLVTDAVAAYGEWSNHEVYLAGPPLMLAATSVALQALGVHPEHIHHDAPA
jgi:NAD(P)H-flavin reductase/hemoglobin-like flavoprotein